MASALCFVRVPRSGHSRAVRELVNGDVEFEVGVWWPGFWSVGAMEHLRFAFWHINIVPPWVHTHTTQKKQGTRSETFGVIRL